AKVAKLLSCRIVAEPWKWRNDVGAVDLAPIVLSFNANYPFPHLIVAAGLVACNKSASLVAAIVQRRERVSLSSSYVGNLIPHSAKVGADVAAGPRPGRHWRQATRSIECYVGNGTGCSSELPVYAGADEILGEGYVAADDGCRAYDHRRVE